MEESPTFLEKIRISSYIIVVSFSIIRWILTYIDKKMFDFIIIFDLIISILLIISLTISIFIIENEGFGPRASFLFIFVFNFVLIVGNTVEAFFTYKNSRYTDFQGICIFIIIMRLFIAVGCNVFNFYIKSRLNPIIQELNIILIPEKNFT